MQVKIITKSGRGYFHKSDKIITRNGDTMFNVYSYSSIDDYYSGDGQYRDKDLILSINMNCIESIDYRE